MSPQAGEGTMPSQGLAEDGGDGAPGGIVVPVQVTGQAGRQVQAVPALGRFGAHGRVTDDGLAR